VGDGRSTTSPKIVDAAPVVATDKPAGSSAPFVVGALAVVLLAATGGLVAWRRRRTI
jgi:LPXTG-motif cell wall-anchored protein